MADNETVFLAYYMTEPTMDEFGQWEPRVEVGSTMERTSGRSYDHIWTIAFKAQVFLLDGEGTPQDPACWRPLNRYLLVTEIRALTPRGLEANTADVLRSEALRQNTEIWDLSTFTTLEHAVSEMARMPSRTWTQGLPWVFSVAEANRWGPPCQDFGGHDVVLAEPQSL